MADKRNVRHLSAALLAMSAALAMYWVLDPARSMPEVWLNRVAAMAAIAGTAVGAFHLGRARE